MKPSLKRSAGCFLAMLLAGSAPLNVLAMSNAEPVFLQAEAQADADLEITALEPAISATVNGMDACLPATVMATYSDGTTAALPVVWNTEGKNLGSSTTLSGTVEGTELEASLTIKAVEPLLSWVIDCNNPNSPRYQNAKDISNLKNESPDQKYDPDNDKSWGYIEDYGEHNSSNPDDSYDQGWYAKSGQDLEYALPVTAGSYSVTFGFKEWWSGYEKSRKMDAYWKDSEGNKSVLGTVNTWNGSSYWATFTYDITPDVDGTIRLGVNKQSGQPDPTLSFIQVSKKLDFEDLKTLVNSIKTLDLSSASDKQKGDLASLHSAATAALRNPDTTQDDLDTIKVNLQSAIKASQTISFTEEQIAANDRILYLYNCGTPDATVTPDGIKRGLYQSSVSQTLNEDPITGLHWGYNGDDAHSKAASRGSDASNMADSIYYMATGLEYDKDKSGFHFTFELPERINQDYELTVGVRNPWDSRTIGVNAEGEHLETFTATKEQLVEKTWTRSVTDNELNVTINNPNRTSESNDPLVSYIIVRAMPAWTKEQVEQRLSEKEETMKDRTFSDASLKIWNDTANAARELLAKENASQPELKKAYEDLETAYNQLKETFVYTSFAGNKSAAWVDNNGEVIQGHGGQVQKMMIDGEMKYAWYGEDRSKGYTPMPGVHLYTSSDLYNWTDEGIVLRTIPVSSEDYGKDQEEGYKADLSIFETDEYFKSLYGDYKNQDPDDPDHYENKAEETYWNLAEDRSILERPKVLYNENTGKYVMWFHSDGRMPNSTGGYARARAGIAIADKATGPFKLVSDIKLYDAKDVTDHGFDSAGGALRDMNLFKDTDGTAYVLYSSDGNETMYIARLNDEYTGLASDSENAVDGTGETAEEMKDADFSRNFIKQSREAPAMFTYKGKYYLMTSGCTGWDANQAQYAMADTPLGPWKVMGDPCVGDTNHTTFSTQSTCFIPVDPEQGKFIYMGDRWTRETLGNSPYVWLPVEFSQDGGMMIRSYTDWTLDDLENKGIFTLETKLPDTASSLADLRNELPDTVEISFGTDKSSRDVAWSFSTDQESALGEVEVTGTLSDGRTILHTVSILNPRTIYFFDCNRQSEGSPYYDLLKDAAPHLLNQSADPLYAPATEENTAVGGRVSVSRSENADSHDVVAYGGAHLYPGGWYAVSNKSITYRMPLEAGEYTLHTGYREWWNQDRSMTITVSDGSSELAKKTFTLAGTDSARQEDLAFSLSEDGEITVTISKAASKDPVLSWLSVTGASRTTDRSKLDAAIKWVDDNLTEESPWTPEETADVRKAYDAARKVEADPLSTQSEIDAAAAALQNAIDALNPVYTPDFTELDKKIAQAEKLKEADYTSSTWKTFSDALKDAKAVRAQDKPEADVIAKAADDLQKAIGSLVTKASLDTKAIEAAIARADALNRDEYSKDTDWDAFDALLTSARNALSSKDSQAELDSEAGALNEAIDKLVKAYVPDFTALDEVITQAYGLKEADYTSSSWKTFSDKLKAAQDVRKEAEPSADDIAKAADDLQNAIDGLVAKASLKTDAIEAAIARADALKRDAYAKDTDWAAFDALLTGARNALTSRDSQEALDQAASTLQEAIEALVPASSLDYTQLDLAIAKAEKLDRDAFTLKSRIALSSALFKARTSRRNAREQTALNTAASDLNAALLTLRRSVDSDALDALNAENQ